MWSISLMSADFSLSQYTVDVKYAECGSLEPYCRKSQAKFPICGMPKVYIDSDRRRKHNTSGVLLHWTGLHFYFHCGSHRDGYADGVQKYTCFQFAAFEWWSCEKSIKAIQAFLPEKRVGPWSTGRIVCSWEHLSFKWLDYRRRPGNQWNECEFFSKGAV